MKENNRELPVVRNKSFKDETVDLDKYAYANCTFKDCKYVYSGGLNINLVDCDLDGGTFVFNEETGRALQVLSFFYRHPGLRGVVEATFENIRGGVYLREADIDDDLNETSKDPH